MYGDCHIGALASAEGSLAGLMSQLAVVVEAYHFCMMMRGVEKQNSMAITSCMLGAFRDSRMTREEFLQLIHSHRTR